MRKILATAIIALLSLSLYAQVPGVPPTGTRGPGANLNQGHVFGKVVDETGKPVEFASVVLLKTTIDPSQSPNSRAEW